jgi:hypothetical protein
VARDIVILSGYGFEGIETEQKGLGRGEAFYPLLSYHTARQQVDLCRTELTNEAQHLILIPTKHLYRVSISRSEDSKNKYVIAPD